ncbi:hypothetical protein [Phytopseudomonas dryadis]|uniref:Uncharacterized protein n=1 Tax=Phytopseudomonas dryadis TaxID=2487520 RepID=A0A4Q9R0K0_9GAMM|nr:MULTISPECIES: hypothetical protein [Pseudomonas]TBU91973.1 hypothetical protein DNK44_13665 [Pseudomonas dryadis]TBV05368.1 hypothetical protein DNK34_12535 [Pseudomonas dryadis]TBV18378.1 hypothetical protein DNK41_08325 [Pseudomonas sp. FRB 230]
MSDKTRPSASEIDPTPPNQPAKDLEGDDVNVVHKETQRHGDKTETVDRVVTPTSIKTKEQEAEKLERANREVSRKLDKP